MQTFEPSFLSLLIIGIAHIWYHVNKYYVVGNARKNSLLTFPCRYQPRSAAGERTGTTSLSYLLVAVTCWFVLLLLYGHAGMDALDLGKQERRGKMQDVFVGRSRFPQTGWARAASISSSGF